VATFSVVIPALDEEDGIASIIERVLAAVPALECVGISHTELIVVDDGSRDATASIVGQFPGVRLIRHPYNRGYGAALKTGFSAAVGDLVGFLDADGTYPPESFPTLCAEALRGADMVVGSRRSGSESQMPLVRRLGNAIWSSLVTVLGNRRVTDPASGMRVFRKAVFKDLCPLPDGLNFTPVMSTRAMYEGLCTVEVPIPYCERTGRSKLSVVRDGTRFLETILWTSLAYNPSKIIAGAGAIMAGAAAVIALTLVGIRLSGVNVLAPQGVAAVFAAVLLGVIGMDLVGLGEVFNMLVALFHRRPVRQGLFRRPLFRRSVGQHYGRAGAAVVMTGIGIGIASLSLSLRGWPIERLWLYLTAGAMLVIGGLQLVLFRVVSRVLTELSQREALTRADMGAER